MRLCACMVGLLRGVLAPPRPGWGRRLSLYIIDTVSTRISCEIDGIQVEKLQSAGCRSAWDSEVQAGD